MDRGAMSLAHLAAMETAGTMADRTEAAVWAYVWATENTRPFGTSGDLVALPIAERSSLRPRGAAPVTLRKPQPRTCVTCAKPVRKSFLLCHDCERRLVRQLGDQAAHLEDLQLERRRQVRKQAPNDGGRSSSQPLPFLPEAGGLIDDQRALLVKWVKRVFGEWGVRSSRTITGPLCASCWHSSCREIRRSFWPAGSVASMASELAVAVPAIRTRDELPVLAADVRQLVGRIMAVIDSPQDRTRIHVGPCPNVWPTDEGKQACPGEVTAVVPADDSEPAWMTCSACAEVWDTTQWTRTGHRVIQRQQQIADQKARAAGFVKQVS